MKPLLVIIVLIAAVTFFGCRNEDEDTRPPEVVRYFDPASNTRFPDQDTTLMHAELTGDVLTLEYSGNPPDIQPGDILLSTQGAGFLRKVESVARQGNTLLLQTSQALFTQAFRNARVDTSARIQPQSMLVENYSSHKVDTVFGITAAHTTYQGRLRCAGSEYGAGQGEFDTEYDWTWTFRDVQIEISDEESNVAFSLGASSIVLGMNLTVDVEIEERDWQVKKFRILKKEDQGIIINDCAFTGSLSLPLNETKIPLLDIPVLAAVPVGLLVFTVGFTAQCGSEVILSLSSAIAAETEIAFNTHTETGAEWVDNAWHSLDSKTPTASFRVDNFDPADGNVSLTATPFLDVAVDISLYAVLGPEIFARAGLPSMTISAPPLEFDAALTLRTGARLTLTLFNVPLWEFSGEVARHQLGHWSTPAAPTDLIASRVSETQIDLSWTDNASDELGFRIARREGLGGEWLSRAEVSGNTQNYSDQNVSSGVDYFYQVRAYNLFGESAPSNIASPSLVSQEKIVFVREESGERDIWIMDSDGSNARPLLARSGSNESAPAFSHQGDRIAFLSNYGGRVEVWMMNSDGSNPLQITHSTAPWITHSGPSWFPQDSLIAYAIRSGSSGPLVIRGVHPDGTGDRLFIDSPNNLDCSPVVNPVNGCLIVHHSDPGDWFPNAHIWISDICSGTHVTLVDGALQEAGGPYSWSSDGSQITLVSMVLNPPVNIWKINADGTWLTQLTAFSGNTVVRCPAWSPDNSHIVCVYGTSGYDQERSICVMNSDGSGFHELYQFAAGSVYGLNWGP